MKTGWPASLRDSPVFLSSIGTAQVQDTTPDFLPELWASISDLHACATEALSAEPSPQPHRQMVLIVLKSDKPASHNHLTYCPLWSQWTILVDISHAHLLTISGIVAKSNRSLSVLTCWAALDLARRPSLNGSIPSLEFYDFKFS